MNRGIPYTYSTGRGGQIDPYSDVEERKLCVIYFNGFLSSGAWLSLFSAIHQFHIKNYY